MSSTAEHTSYRGPERRHHRVLVTRNSEYHCRDGVCVAVRDLRTRHFVAEHPALGKHISGGLRFNESGGIESATAGPDPRPGDQVFFTAEGEGERTVITSPLSAIERPPKDIVKTYTH
jgi:hypothetical protein